MVTAPEYDLSKIEELKDHIEKYHYTNVRDASQTTVTNARWVAWHKEIHYNSTSSSKYILAPHIHVMAPSEDIPW